MAPYLFDVFICDLEVVKKENGSELLLGQFASKLQVFKSEHELSPMNQIVRCK